MPQSVMYRIAARYSAWFNRRASAPLAPGCGVYWLIREKSTVCGGKCADT